MNPRFGYIRPSSPRPLLTRECASTCCAFTTIMGLGLVITASWPSSSARHLHYTCQSSPAPLKWVVMLAPLAFVFFFSFKIQTMSDSTAQMTFWAFCAVMGLSLASVFLVFTGASIARTFFIAATMFGATSLYGYVTKRDLGEIRLVPHHGSDRCDDRVDRQHLPRLQRLQFAVSVIGISRIRWPDRLGYAEHQGAVCRELRSGKPAEDCRLRRSLALPQLRQHLPASAEPHRPARRITSPNNSRRKSTMDYNDRQAIEGLFGKLSHVESQSGPRDAEADAFIRDRIASQPGAPISWRRRSLCRNRRWIRRSGGSRSWNTSSPPALPLAAASSPACSAARNRSSCPCSTAGHAPGWPLGRSAQPPAIRGVGRLRHRDLASKGMGQPQRGGGFLAGAAQTAMGVAGGVLLGNAIAGLIGGDEAQAAENACRRAGRRRRHGRRHAVLRTVLSIDGPDICPGLTVGHFFIT